MKEDDMIKLRSIVFGHINARLEDLALECIVDVIHEIFDIYTTSDDTKAETWIYDDGIYVPNGVSKIKEFTREVLVQAFTPQRANKVIAKIQADTQIDAKKFFENNYINQIPVQNGILNIETLELNKFSPEKIFFNKMPVNYDEDKECKMIDSFLDDVLSSSDDKKIFYELVGFCLLKEYKFEKAFMFVGNGRNGKDKSLELIKRLIGIDNCCSFPLSSLKADSFIISEFFGKMINMAGDIGNVDLKETATFKALTGRSLMSANRKFLSSITFENYAKFVFGCNELPMVYDNSRGFWDRWVLFEFPYTFVSKEELEEKGDDKFIKLRNPDIIKEITTESEMSGFLNMALLGLKRLLKNKSFSTAKGCDDVKSTWIKKSNSFMAFCYDLIEEDNSSIIPKTELRKMYSKYCKNHKIQTKSDVVIKRVLQDNYGVGDEFTYVLGDSRQWVWTGIKLKENPNL